MSQPSPTRPRHLWPRFTLRVLLATVTLLCIGLGIWTHRAREQANVVRLIGIENVYYDYHLRAAPDPDRAEPPEPKWLIDLLGVDFFHLPKGILVCPVRRTEVATQLHSLELLILVGEADEPRFETLKRCRRLKVLRIQSPNINDQTLAIVGSLPHIVDVCLLGEGGISSDGLAALAEAKTLKRIHVTGCGESVSTIDACPFRDLGSVDELLIVRGCGLGAELVDRW